MKHAEFAYWLQGFFELSDLEGNVSISAKQAESISRHALLAKEVEGEFNSLEAFTYGALVASKGLDFVQSDVVKSIRTQLADLFKHVIDSSYENQVDLNKIHHEFPPPPSSSGTVFRC